MNHESEPPNLIYSPNFDSGAARIPPRPPLPPPRNANSSYSNTSYSNPLSYNAYSGYSPSYNRPFYGGYNSYSPYNNYYNSFGGPRLPHNSGFTEEAQESSREAFANIERIVHTFGSVNMMIESTYYALQSSFNAVLSVAENLSRLKEQFGQILSAFTLIRSIQWLLKRLFYLLGLRAQDPSTELAWKEAANASFEEFSGETSRRSAWPMMIFVASVYIGPVLMWKLINKMRRKEKLSEKDVKEGNGYYAVAKFNYKAQSPEELSFNAGDYLKLAPYEKQTDKLWPLASNGQRSGIVPVNYIDIKLNSVSAGLEKNASVNVKNPYSYNTQMTNEKHSSSPYQTLVPTSTTFKQSEENLDSVKELKPSLPSSEAKDENKGKDSQE
ncbi:Peroxisomal membrane protein PEX13 [Armadillidium nasatum]|uniref:Peroxisomal membrane protein PEX13 n=1 Tax=Armadillidium nasatum TaxID=96803 RepID=A0A5N5SPD5_9CRUS|nr:Peroxisomal membrane protein PEX13 [Armadillidium nasatum]